MELSTYDVFISYKSEDVLYAQNLYGRLTKKGFRTWFDKIRLQPGFRWHEEIEDGCEASRILLPVLTPRWQTSEWTKFETYGAESIIPLLFEGSWEEVAPSPLRSYQNFALDLSDDTRADWNRLFSAIRELLAQPAPDKTKRLAHLKYRANCHFVGREKDLIRINEALHQRPSTAMTQGSVHALSALGGVGKTTLARQYADKFWRLYRDIFWVDARDDLAGGFAAIALVLFPYMLTSKIDSLAERALQRLSERTHRLLILDDVQDEETIQDWIPKSGGCHTIITSRFAGWSAAVENIPVYLLDAGPSCELLLNRTGRTDNPENRAACERLAAKLGYLPLALEHAAAYIEQEGPGFEFDDYIDIYEKAAPELLSEKSEGSTQYPHSVKKTWKSTTAKLTWESRAVLRMSAYLSPKPIPKSFFTAATSIVLDLAQTMARDETGMPAADYQRELRADIIRVSMHELARYSMINSLGQGFSVHPLVQAVEQFETVGSVDEAVMASCICMLRTARPENISDVSMWEGWRDWLPHARSVIDWAEQKGIKTGIGELYSWAGAWHEHIADYQQAESILRKVLSIEEEQQGNLSPLVALRLNNLGGVLREVGRFSEAEILYQRALDIIEACKENNLGLSCRVLNNLGLVFKDTGRLQEAENLFSRALGVVQDQRSEETSLKTALLSNLASVYLETNRLKMAECYYLSALDLDRQAFGDEHPLLAMSLLNIAGLQMFTNRLVEAEIHCQQALSISTRAHGMDHPATAQCLNNLGTVYQAMRDFERAEPLIRRALEIDETVYGSRHKKVAIHLNNLAVLLKDTGRLADAEQIMRRSLKIREEALGPDHPLTIHSYSRLAGVLFLLGKLGEAETLARTSLEEWLQSETPRAYKSGRTHRIMALILDRKGQNEAAKKMMAEAVAIHEETLVSDDPRLAAVRSEFAQLGF